MKPRPGPLTVTLAPMTGAEPASTTRPRTVPPAERRTVPTSAVLPAATLIPDTAAGAQSGAFTSSTYSPSPRSSRLKRPSAAPNVSDRPPLVACRPVGRAETRKPSTGFPPSSTTVPVMEPAGARTKSTPAAPASALRRAMPMPTSADEWLDC